jgi:hypothetical protein
VDLFVRQLNANTTKSFLVGADSDRVGSDGALPLHIQTNKIEAESELLLVLEGM